MRFLAAVPLIAALLALAVPARAGEPAAVGLVDPALGQWHLTDHEGDVYSFFFGNPGDLPLAGDWDCDGVDTPGMFRQADGYVYLRNSSTQGVADVRFYFGNGGDLPLAGDFDGDGCDTVSVYRPAESRVYVINRLGTAEQGLGVADYWYVFGDRGDTPFVGDFDADGVDTVGLHRRSTGLVYLRQSNTTGPADLSYVFGDAGDRLVAASWEAGRVDTPAVFRPADATFYVKHSHGVGAADATRRLGSGSMRPVAGAFGDLPHAPGLASPAPGVADDLGDAVNAARRTQGLPVLAVDPLASGVAADRAWELYRLGYLTHSLFGTWLADQLRDAGVPVYRVWENLAVAQTPEQVVDLWLRSPGHRSNLLDAGVGRLGVGVADGPDGRYFVAIGAG